MASFQKKNQGEAVLNTLSILERAEHLASRRFFYKLHREQKVPAKKCFPLSKRVHNLSSTNFANTMATGGGGTLSTLPSETWPRMQAHLLSRGTNLSTKAVKQQATHNGEHGKFPTFPLRHNAPDANFSTHSMHYHKKCKK